MGNSNTFSRDVRAAKSNKGVAKPKDKIIGNSSTEDWLNDFEDDVSMMGYRDYSPYRERSSIDIHTPTGMIDMSETGIPLMANGQYLPPYSGIHNMGTPYVREERMARYGGGLYQYAPGGTPGRPPLKPKPIFPTGPGRYRSSQGYIDADKVSQNSPWFNPELAIDEYLGFPQHYAAIASQSSNAPPVDNIRHSVASYKTAKAISDKASPYIGNFYGNLAGVVGANALGLAHEIQKFPNQMDDVFQGGRPFWNTIEENRQDLKNNLYGSLQVFNGMTPGGTTEYLKQQSKKGNLAKGYVEDNPVLPKGEIVLNDNTRVVRKDGGALNKFQDAGQVSYLNTPIYKDFNDYYERNKDATTYVDKKITKLYPTGPVNVLGDNYLDFAYQQNNPEMHCTEEGCTARANRPIAASFFGDGASWFQNPETTKKDFGATYSTPRKPTAEEIKKYPYMTGDEDLGSMDAWDILDQASKRYPKNVMFSNVKYAKDYNNDINAALNDYGSGVKTVDQIWKEYDIPVGSYINMGTSSPDGGHGRPDLIAGSHTVRVVGYAADGEPLIADFGQIRKLSDPNYYRNRVAGIVSVPGKEKYTYKYFKDQEALEKKANKDPYIKDINSENYGEDYKNFHNNIVKEKNYIAAQLGVSPEKYDQYAKIALTLGGAETEFGKGFTYNIPLLDKMGESTGVAQVTEANVADKYKKTLAKYKDNPEAYNAMSALLYVKELDAYKDKWMKSGKKATERPFVRSSGDAEEMIKNDVRSMQGRKPQGYINSPNSGDIFRYTDANDKPREIELPYKQIWQSDADYEKEVNDMLKKTDPTLRFSAKGTKGERTIYKKTKGNTIPEKLEDFVYYAWQAPNAVAYGDAQGNSTYYKKAKDIEAKLFGQKLAKKEMGGESGWLDEYNDFKYGGMKKYKTLPKGTTKNVVRGVNKLFAPDPKLFGPFGRKAFDPNSKFEYGGWLDEYQTKGEVLPVLEDDRPFEEQHLAAQKQKAIATEAYLKAVAEDKMRQSLTGTRPGNGTRFGDLRSNQDNTRVVKYIPNLPKKPLTKAQQEAAGIYSVKTAENNLDKAQKEAAKFERIKAANKAQAEQGFPTTRQEWADQTQAIGPKLSLQNIPGIGQYVPDILDVTGGLGDMASSLASAPLRAQQEDSYMPYVKAFAAPVIQGYFGGMGAKNTGQFLNNVFNPFAGLNVKGLRRKPAPNAELDPNHYEFSNPEMTDYFKQRPKGEAEYYDNLLAKKQAEADFNYEALYGTPDEKERWLQQLEQEHQADLASQFDDELEGGIELFGDSDDPFGNYQNAVNARTTNNNADNILNTPQAIRTQAIRNYIQRDTPNAEQFVTTPSSLPPPPTYEEYLNNASSIGTTPLSREQYEYINNTPTPSLQSTPPTPQGWMGIQEPDWIRNSPGLFGTPQTNQTPPRVLGQIDLSGLTRLRDAIGRSRQAASAPVGYSQADIDNARRQYWAQMYRNPYSSNVNLPQRDMDIIASQGMGNSSDYAPVTNKSSFTKEELLERLPEADRKLIEDMSDEEFKKTIFKPTGGISSYVPGNDVSQMTYNPDTGTMQLKDSTPMTNQEYADAFNEKLDRLNEIIAKNNKSGVNYRVKELTPGGNLVFETPEQTVKRKLTSREQQELDLFNKDPEDWATKEAGLKKEGYIWKLADELAAPTFANKQDAVDYIKGKIIDNFGNKQLSGTSAWYVGINPARWHGNVEDIANTEYFQNIPGLNMRNTTSGVFPDYVARRGTGTYGSINDYLKEIGLGRVKPGFNSQTQYSKGLWEDLVKKGKGFGFYKDPDLIYGTMRKYGGWLQDYE